MNIELYKAAERGTADYGWLKPNYYFSFSQYHNPRRVHFGLLRVLNDDFIDGGGMFPEHPHDNMEIVTIPLSGAIAHADSTGGRGVIRSGDVQIMSAGSGIRHSESNASATDPVTLFQIWVFPKLRNIEPRYDQRNFDKEGRINRWQTMVSPLKEDDALWINQDARFSMAELDEGKSLEYANGFAGNQVLLLVVEGAALTGTTELNRRDAAGISGTDNFTVTAREHCTLLAIEVPPLPV
jgi:hypothetical protein